MSSAVATANVMENYTIQQPPSITTRQSLPLLPSLSSPSSSSTTSIVTTTKGNDTTTAATTVTTTTGTDTVPSTICRVIAIEDEEEDSRECPSQGVSEIERDDVYHLGIDERLYAKNNQQHHNHNNHQLTTTKHYLFTMYSRRVNGLRHRHQQQQGGINNSNAFREHRDSNSFDSHDSDTEDDESPLPNLIQRKQQQMHRFRCHHHNQLLLPVLSNNTTRGNNHKDNKLVGTGKILMNGEHLVTSNDEMNKKLDSNDSNNKNKRKTPSPVLGLEPAPVSIEPLLQLPSCDEQEDDDEVMSMGHNDDNGNAANGAVSSFNDDGYYSEDDNNNSNSNSNAMLPSPGRRISLTPISRRLTLQFDSISFYSPVKGSRTKRRKTMDTTARS